jgi:hypothetical protein
MRCRAWPHQQGVAGKTGSPRPGSRSCCTTGKEPRWWRRWLGSADLFARHVRGTLDGRSRAVLVDTGLFGTTGQLLADGFPDLEVSSVLIARSNYRREAMPRHAKVLGVSVQSDGYSPIQRRTAVLRYWQFMESLFEPALESVRTFAEHDGVPRSNLEVENWQSRVRPTRVRRSPGSSITSRHSHLGPLSR